MQVIINNQSWGKGSTASAIIPKKGNDGKSGAFLCSIHDLQGHAPIEWVRELDGETPGKFQPAVELWFSTVHGVDGKSLFDENGNRRVDAEGKPLISMYDRIVERLAECSAKGVSFAMEFTVQSVRLPDPVWGNGENRNTLYQTATINVDRYAPRRFFELEQGTVEGL